MSMKISSSQGGAEYRLPWARYHVPLGRGKGYFTGVARYISFVVKKGIFKPFTVELIFCMIIGLFSLIFLR